MWPSRSKPSPSNDTMRALNNLRRALYVVAGILGLIGAACRGPGAMVRYFARKSIFRQVGRATRW